MTWPRMTLRSSITSRNRATSASAASRSGASTSKIAFSRPTWGFTTHDAHCDRDTVVMEEPNARGDDLSGVLGSRAGVQPQVVDLAHRDATRPESTGLQQVAEREVVAHVAAADPHEPRLGIGRGQHLQRDVGVHGSMCRDLLGDDRELLGRHAEMVRQHLHERLATLLLRSELDGHALEQALELLHERADVAVPADPL